MKNKVKENPDPALEHGNFIIAIVDDESKFVPVAQFLNTHEQCESWIARWGETGRTYHVLHIKGSYEQTEKIIHGFKRVEVYGYGARDQSESNQLKESGNEIETT